jgi:hypothetical protein
MLSAAVHRWRRWLPRLPLPACVSVCRYSGDFGKTERDMIEWLIPYLSPAVRASIAGVTKYKVSYLPYDWSSNAK